MRINRQRGPLPVSWLVFLSSLILLIGGGEPCRGEKVDIEGPVLGLTYRGRHRAYPVGFFSTPKVINDSIHQQEIVIFHDAGLNLSFAYCRTLFGEPIEFSGEVVGTIADDLTTMTRWDMSSGEAVGGNLTGMELVPLRLTTTSWPDWVSTYPDTTVFLSVGP